MTNWTFADWCVFGGFIGAFAGVLQGTLWPHKYSGYRVWLPVTLGVVCLLLQTTTMQLTGLVLLIVSFGLALLNRRQRVIKWTILLLSVVGLSLVIVGLARQERSSVNAGMGKFDSLSELHSGLPDIRENPCLTMASVDYHSPKCVSERNWLLVLRVGVAVVGLVLVAILLSSRLKVGFPFDISMD